MQEDADVLTINLQHDRQRVLATAILQGAVVKAGGLSTLSCKLHHFG
jgi:hypothetical protein